MTDGVYSRVRSKVKGHNRALITIWAGLIYTVSILLIPARDQAGDAKTKNIVVHESNLLLGYGAQRVTRCGVMRGGVHPSATIL